jgi:hypothetical protein
MGEKVRWVGESCVFVFAGIVFRRAVGSLAGLVLEDDDFIYTEDGQCSGDVAGEICFLVMGLGTAERISK